MKKQDRLFVYETFESLGKIEELCSAVSFFFSDIYDIENTFGRTSKYANISRHTIFMAIERSKTLTIDILRKIDIIEQNKIMTKTEDLKTLISGMLSTIESIEADYENKNYDGIVKKLEVIGNKCSEIKDAFKRKV